MVRAEKLKEIEAKWQSKWSSSKAFEPEIDPLRTGDEKFLCTFPYPYVNGRPHVGHLFTMMRVEAMARYQRMRGKNVLFPQAWHCTGQPIVNAAQRVISGDEQQIQVLRDFGVTDEEIGNFKNPVHWIEYFVPRYKEDVQSLGMSIDWRREFMTTDLNPHYDRFIRWQMKKLKEKDYVALGKHPVVWCPKEEAAVGDHGRRSGEGETAQEFTIIIFTIEEGENIDERVMPGCKIPVATLRPETISGVTNLWAHPKAEYVIAKVDGEEWIISEECANKLSEQERKVEIKSKIAGSKLIGLKVSGPSQFNVPIVPILPATFVSPSKGTGVVMSVPSDAPDDYIALRDLQRDEKQIKEFDIAWVKEIKPIPIIDGGEFGNLPAVKVVEDMKIVNQKERDRLDAAKKLVYKKGYYEGVMLSGKYKGEKVEAAKEKIKKNLLASKDAQVFYELTGPVVCRCLTPCVVKVVQNQWFVMYSDPEWKKITHKALDRMKLYPEKSRAQFDHVIDWLREWAATRSNGLGSRLPWDEQWLVESLTDSTLYNSYYTFAHIIKNLPEVQVTDELFDYVLLGKGTPKDKKWEEMRALFEYWYPVDFRNSGKDLIQNHFVFMLFTHTAFWPDDETKWPRGYGVNGWVTVDGQKMSKSLGNLIPVQKMVEKYGADASRLTMLNGGEGMDDPNWDSELARNTVHRLEVLLELCETHAQESLQAKQDARHEELPIDDWFASALHRIIKETTAHMEEAEFRSAIQLCWFEMNNLIKRYLRLTANSPFAPLMRFALETQIKLIQPFVPHAAAECWETLGGQGVLAFEPWPQHDDNLIDATLEATQDLIENLASDIRSVQQLLRRETLSSVKVIVAEKWLFSFTAELRAQLNDTRDIRSILAALTPNYREHMPQITKMLPMLVKDPSRMPSNDSTQEQELAAVRGAASYLEKQLGAKIIVEAAEDSKEAKAKAAFPARPAILLE